MRASCRFSSPPDPLQVFTKLSLLQLCVKFSDVKVTNSSHDERARVLGSFYFFCLFCTCDFFTLLCHRGLKRNLFRRNVAKELRDKHWALFQSSPKLNCMLITRLICIRRKSSRFLFPVFMISARNAWDHGRPIGKDRRKKSLALLKQAQPTGNVSHPVMLPWLHPFWYANFTVCVFLVNFRVNRQPTTGNTCAFAG